MAHQWRNVCKEDGTFLHRTEEGIPDVTSEYAQWGGISYNLQEADNYMLNASIGFWNENKPRTGFHSTLYTREYPELATERLDFAHNRNSRPWFDIYFQKELKEAVSGIERCRNIYRQS